MPVTLKIISYQRLTPGQDERFSPDAKRFSIGRGQENHWTLPDPQRFMSGTHCWLEERGGAWYLTDTSTNGTYINGSDKRVEKNGSVKLRSGDRIKLGDYELEVSVDDQPGAAAGPAHAGDTPLEDEEDIFASPKAAEPPREREGRKEANTPLSQLDDGLLGEGVSIDDLYGLDQDDEEQQEPPSLARGDDRGSPMEQHFSAPRVEQKADEVLPEEYAVNLDEIPDNWDDDTGVVETPEEPDAAAAPAPPPAEEAPSRRAAPEPPAVFPETEDRARPDRPQDRPQDRPESATGAPPEAARQSLPDAQTALAAFAEGCGLDPKQLQSQDEAAFFQSAGELLHTMVEGLMQAIASRGQIKSEFRLEQTMIGPTRNNPFKFSVSPQETLLRLFGPADSAYLAGPAAAAEAIDDINAHQMAVLAGTEAALKSLLRRFKPSTLEARFGEDSALAKAVPMIRKAKYWEFFKALYDEVSEATDDDFQKFFGAEFSNAYEQQLERLKVSRKEPTK